MSAAVYALIIRRLGSKAKACTPSEAHNNLQKPAKRIGHPRPNSFSENLLLTQMRSKRSTRWRLTWWSNWFPFVSRHVDSNDPDSHEQAQVIN